MKQFKCPKCGSKKFTIVRRRYIIADFSREGAIEGHPMISDGGESYHLMFCDNCAEPIEGKMAQEILQEVI